MATSKRRLPIAGAQDPGHADPLKAMRGDTRALVRLRREALRATTARACGGAINDAGTFLHNAGLLDDRPTFTGKLTLALADILRMRPWRPDIFDALCERIIDLGWPVESRCNNYAEAVKHALRNDETDVALAAIQRAPHLTPISRLTVTFATSIEDPVLVAILAKKIAASNDLDLDEPLGMLFYETSLKSSAGVILRAIDKRLLDYSTRVAAAIGQRRAFLMMVAAGGDPFNPDNKHFHMAHHDTLPILDMLRTAHGRMQLLREHQSMPERPDERHSGDSPCQEIRWRGNNFRARNDPPRDTPIAARAGATGGRTA